MLRVLVVDDSGFVRKALKRVIEAEGDATVVGEASTGREVEAALVATPADVVTLDVNLPDISGLEVLRALRAKRPEVAVLMLSALTHEGAVTTVEALTLGAADFIDKSRFGSMDITQLGEELMEKLRAIARTREERGVRTRITKPAVPPIDLSRCDLCVIGASTGGPGAIQTLLHALPCAPHFPIVIAQHMPVGFTDPFARRLSTLCKVVVSEARDGEAMLAGRAYIAPGGKQLRLTQARTASITVDPAAGVAPCVDFLFESAIKVSRGRVLGVLLTGMGRDGARGLLAIKQAGGVTIAQDAATSIVYGMPRAAIELGAATYELGLEDLCSLFHHLGASSLEAV